MIIASRARPHMGEFTHFCREAMDVGIAQASGWWGWKPELTAT